jgi:hypothetical protein
MAITGPAHLAHKFEACPPTQTMSSPCHDIPSLCSQSVRDWHLPGKPMPRPRLNQSKGGDIIRSYIVNMRTQN